MSDLCLVTGGAGFIGSHLVDGLVKAGLKVRVLDDLSTGLKENLIHHGKNIDVIEGTILEPDTVAKAVRGVKVIYHLGALASVAAPKLRKLVRAARFLLHMHPAWRRAIVRFDVVGVQGNPRGLYEIAWIKDAFRTG